MTRTPTARVLLMPCATRLEGAEGRQDRVVLYEGLTRGEKDFNALVTKIKASGADTVYFGGLYNEAGQCCGNCATKASESQLSLR